MNVDRHGGRWAVAALCAILALGVGLRVYYALEKEDGVQDDSIRYYFIAQSLYEDGDFDATQVERDDAYHPGSPLFHAGIFYLTGGVNPKASRVAAALLSGLMILFTYLLAAEARLDRGHASGLLPCARRHAGLIAALLIAVYPSSIDFYRSLMNEPLASITLVGAIWSFLWAADRFSVWAWLLPGGLVGLTVMFRPEAIVFALALAALALLPPGRRRGTAAPGLRRPESSYSLPRSFSCPVDDSQRAHEDSSPRSPRAVATPSSSAPTSRATAITSRPTTSGRAARRLTTSDPAVLETCRTGYMLGDVLEVIAAREHPDLSQDEALSKLGREQLADDITDHPVEYAGVLGAEVLEHVGPGRGRQAATGRPRVRRRLVPPPCLPGRTGWSRPAGGPPPLGSVGRGLGPGPGDLDRNGAAGAAASSGRPAAAGLRLSPAMRWRLAGPGPSGCGDRSPSQ